MLILSDVAVPILIWIVVKGGRSAPWILEHVINFLLGRHNNSINNIQFEYPKYNKPIHKNDHQYLKGSNYIIAFVMYAQYLILKLFFISPMSETPN